MTRSTKGTVLENAALIELGISPIVVSGMVTLLHRVNACYIGGAEVVWNACYIGRNSVLWDGWFMWSSVVVWSWRCCLGHLLIVPC